MIYFENYFSHRRQQTFLYSENTVNIYFILNTNGTMCDQTFNKQYKEL